MFWKKEEKYMYNLSLNIKKPQKLNNQINNKTN